MDVSDIGLHTKSDRRSSVASSTCSLARANSMSRGISIKTVSPSYHTRHVPDSDSAPAFANGRARKDSMNTYSTSSSASQSPGASPGAFGASQAPGASELKTFHSRRSSSTTLRSDSASQSSDPISTNSSYGPKMDYRRSSSFASGGNYDFALPPPAELSRLDINEQLRLLALKEMSVVEMRDSIANMKSKLHDSECDLANLRHLIQKSLYRELNLQHQVTQRTTHNPNPQPEKVTPTALPNGNVTTPLRPSKKQNESRGAKVAEEKPHTRAPDRSSKLWANLSKPITFIQSLDSMISNEFEKSIMGDLKRENPGHHARRDSQAQRGRNHQYQDENYRKHQQNQSQNHNQDQNHYNHNPHKQDHTNQDHQRHILHQQNLASRRRHSDEARPNQDRDIGKKDADDMFYAVSNSLWSFVNEVKTNVISTINDNAEHLVSPPKSPPAHEPSDEITYSPLNCELEDSGDFEKSGDDEESIDLSMYASMRRKK